MSGQGKAPEEIVKLRAAAPKVARLSRPVVLTAAGLGALGVGAALAMALQPKAPKPVKPAEIADTKPPLSMMAEGPKTYSDVPRLGPPLPGDLGGPILAAQNRTSPTAAPSSAVASSPEVQARRAALEAARASGVFLPNAGRERSSAEPPRAPPALPDPLPVAVSGNLPAELPPIQASGGDQAQKRAFLQASRTPTISAHTPQPRAGRLVLQAQTVITAALVTAVSSDLPGPISAQVTRHVYDSLTGRTVLIPQGSRLIGTYDSQVSFGQRRLLLAWDRVVFPDGRSLELDRLIGGDAAGRSGASDKVEAHWSSMAKAALLSSTLGVAAELGADDEGGVARALRRGAQDTFNQAGQQVVRRQLDVQPTLTLRAGLPITILVTRDIVFDGVR
jgi:type IV secretion system protein VirB10